MAHDASDHRGDPNEAHGACPAATEPADLIAALQDGFSILDANGVHLDVNPAMTAMTGFSREELIGVGPPHPYWPPEELPAIRAALQRALGGKRETYELTFMRKNGERFPVLVAPSQIVNSEGEVVCCFATVKDMSERGATEAALRRAADEWRRTFDAVPDLIALIDSRHRIVRANRAMADRLGLHPREVVGLTCYELVHDLHEPPPFCPHRRSLASGRPEREELVEEPNLGGFFDVVTTPLHDETGVLVGSVHVARDVTEQKRTQDALRALAETAGDAGLDVGRLLVRELARSTGCRCALLAHIDQEDPGVAHAAAVWKDTDFAKAFDCPLAGTPCEHVVEHGTGFFGEGVQRLFPEAHLLRELDAESFWGTALRGADGRIIGVLAVVDDRPMTENPRTLTLLQSFATRAAAEMERARTVAALAASEARYETFLNATDDIAFLKDDKLRYVIVNRANAEFLGRPVEEIVGRTDETLMPPEAAQGCRASDLMALRRNDTVIVEEPVGDRVYEVRKFPVPLEGGKTGVGGYARDITERRRAEQALAESALRLRATLHDTVQAMGEIVGLRDPYTARHEKTVTRLALAVADDLGLDEDTREGLLLAGQVHDIGKICVPAEILSKPSALTDMEYRLVQQHAQTGREILAGIGFHQPVAEIVGQHHERCDGSGYPDGLRGSRIRIEARIIAVADVVEAMASHRPYRAALGMEAALTELRRGAGTLYDADVVAACERVLVAGFRLDE